MSVSISRWRQHGADQTGSHVPCRACLDLALCDFTACRLSLDAGVGSWRSLSGCFGASATSALATSLGSQPATSPPSCLPTYLRLTPQIWPKTYVGNTTENSRAAPRFGTARLEVVRAIGVRSAYSLQAKVGGRRGRKPRTAAMPEEEGRTRTGPCGVRCYRCPLFG